MRLSRTAEKRAERLRELARKSAYETELSTGVAPLEFASPKDVTELISAYSKVRGGEAIAAAHELEASKDPLAMAAKLMPDVNESVLNFLVAQCSYRYFCLKYFKHLFYRGMCHNYHDVYFELIREVETHRTITPAIVAGPPEWGKTMIGAVMLPLHSIIFDNIVYLPSGLEKDLSKRFTALITVVEKNARRNLETIKDELETNELIRSDFGEFYRVPGSKSRNETWSESVAVTLNERRIEIFGRKGKIRGAVWRGHRPDMIVGDDLEDDENSMSLLRQDRDHAWLRMVVNRTPKENGNVLILGNLVNPNGLLDRWIKEGTKKKWRVKVFRLYDEDPITKQKTYTWAEEFGEEYEKHKRDVTGDQNFEAEFLSNPEAYARELNLSDIKYYTFDEDFRQLLERMVVYSAADPASSVSSRSDFTAIVSMAEDPITGIIYMLPSINEKVPTGQQADLILDVQQQWGAIQFGVESIAYQNALIDRLEERRRERGNMYFQCVPITHPYLTKKKERIAQRLFKRLADGVIRLPENDQVARIFADQIVNLKTTMFDDVVDSAEMCIRLRDKDLGIRSGVRTSFAVIKENDPVQRVPITRKRVTFVPLSEEHPKFVKRMTRREIGNAAN